MSKTGWIVLASIVVVGVGVGSFFIGKSIGKKASGNED